MKVIHFGSYWMGENDVVALMATALQNREDIEVVLVDPKIYSGLSEGWITREGEVNWIKDSPLFELVASIKPDVIICNAGGLSPTENAHKVLESMGVLRVGIALSDPDDFFTRSKYFSRYFNLFFTNAIYSISQYKSLSVNAHLLPFGAEPTFHKPLGLPFKYDVVVVGGKRPDRQKLVTMLRKRQIKVGCFGSGWIDDVFPFNLLKIFGEKNSRRMLRFFDFIKEVHGAKHNKALNAAPLYISFSGTYAGFTNVKVGLFEAASAGCCSVVQDFPEVHDYFENGYEMVTFKSFEDAVEIIATLTENQEKAKTIGINARNRILSDHSWERRWDSVFSLINEMIICK